MKTAAARAANNGPNSQGRSKMRMDAPNSEPTAGYASTPATGYADLLAAFGLVPVGGDRGGATPQAGGVAFQSQSLAIHLGIALQDALDVAAATLRIGQTDLAAPGRGGRKADVRQRENGGVVGDDLGLESRLAAGNVGQAGRGLAAGHVVLVRRDGDGRQDGDDRHHDHQLDQSEASTAGTHNPPLLGQSG